MSQLWDPIKTIATLLFLALGVGNLPVAQDRTDYPLTPDSPCGGRGPCWVVLDDWNDSSWNELVDDTFHTGSSSMAAVRWFKSENDRTLQDCPANPPLVESTSQFCGVTDELSNVLLSHAMGSNQDRYEMLHNFAELLRAPSINDLQCWKYYVDGVQAYSDHSQVCVEMDSASDASLRILGAYGIACAKQDSGVWEIGGVDYCSDFDQQASAIWGDGTPLHGEIRLLGNGQYYLANGFMNQAGAPTATQSFRPDYYELQFLMDQAEADNDPTRIQGVLDMLDDYVISLGDNQVHLGKTGHFDSDTLTYTCDELCSPPYVDNTDTWRAIPALSGLLNVHPERVPLSQISSLFAYWWDNFSGGHPTLYGPTQDKPFEIYSNSVNGLVAQVDGSHRTLSMWLPLGAYFDAGYTQQAINWLIDNRYDPNGRRFWASSYYAGYYSQFAQRGIGSATGMIDRRLWAERCADDDGDGFASCAGDCDDSVTSIHWGVSEDCISGTDDNCDGLADCQDVAGCPSGPGAPPDEIGGMMFGADGQTLSWTAQAGVVTYDVLHGTVAQLRLDGGFASSECFASRVPAASVVVSDQPDPGEALYYISRAKEDPCLLGSWGGALRDVVSLNCP